MSAMMEIITSMSDGDMSKISNNDENMDTVINFSELMKDEIFKDSINNLSAEQKDAFEAMKDMKMSMKMNSEEMIMGFGWDFKNINELKDVFSKISKAQNLNNPSGNNGMNGSPLMKSFSGENQNISYDYNEKVFSRNVTLKEKLTKEEKEQMKNAMSMKQDSEELMNSMKYTIILNFPKAIKSVNVDNAVFTNNRKTVKISYTISTYLYEPTLLSNRFYR